MADIAWHPSLSAILLASCGLACAAEATQAVRESAAIAIEAESVLPSGWQMQAVPAAPGKVLKLLTRQALAPPARYRLIVVPGSGCTGWLPVAQRYFSGLLHAELLLLHKPGVDSRAGLGANCSQDFIQNDSLSSWSRQAKTALHAHYANTSATPARPAMPQPAPALPELLVGISEGAELLPSLAPEIPTLAGLVMISASGLDPREAGQLQAQRLGQSEAWQALETAGSTTLDNSELLEGRSLRYWRELWQWRVAQPLLQAPWPLLRVWGDADELVPLAAYQRFPTLQGDRQWPFCDIRLAHADHALQSTERDGLQWLWARLERWAREPEKGFCDVVPP